MEKTTQVTIAGTLFHLTEAAYKKLESYLHSLKAHFEGESDRDEILRDIESRIAEKLLEKKRAVIMAEDMASVLAEMGSASELGDMEPSEAPRSASRKLYRDTDNAWIAGVASGIANYFDIDPFVVRLLFFISIFFGGTGILLYIILWIFVPEAKTSSQKLEMRGDPVNLEGIARVVREGVENARESGIIRKSANVIHSFMRSFFRVLGKILGFVISVGSFFALIGLLIGTGIIATNWNAPYNDFPLRGAVSEPLFFAGLAAGFVAILIPLIAVFALGIRLWSKRTVFPSAIAFGLIGIWALAISAGVTIAVKVAGEYFEYERTNPAFKEVTRAVEAPAFTVVQAYDGRITIKEGEVQGVEMKGRAADLQNVIVGVKDGILSVRERDEHERFCIFCPENQPEIVITTPGLESVYLQGASATFEGFTDSELKIDTRRSSLRGDLDVSFLTLEAQGGSVRATILAETLMLAAKQSHFDLDGSASSATLNLTDTSFEGSSFAIQNATVTTDSSFVKLDVTGELKKNNDPASRVVLKEAIE